MPTLLSAGVNHMVNVTIRYNSHSERLVHELCGLPAETEWVEFKHNNTDPQMIGELISSLSNAATLRGVQTAHVVWGVHDKTHDIIGTTFNPAGARRGNQNLESWLVQMLAPRLHIRFHAFEIDCLPVVVLAIPAARDWPTAFAGRERIRVGSFQRSLQDVPEIERTLWRCFDQTPFERQIALADQSADEVLTLLDYPAYFDLLELQLPSDRAGILTGIQGDDMIKPEWCRELGRNKSWCRVARPRPAVVSDSCEEGGSPDLL